MIDHHCHPFDVEPGRLDWRHLTLDLVGDDAEGSGGDGGERRRARLRPTFLWFELLRSRLAEHLGCATDEVEVARGEAAQRDYAGYVRALFSSAGLDELIMDPVWPPGSAEQAPLFADLSGCRVHLIFRIDTVIDELLAAGVGYAELVSRFDEALDSAVRSGYRGLKTVLAYRTGLAVDPDVTPAEARASMTDERPVARRAKPLRDLLMRRALGFAADNALPMQVHSGFGDSDLRLSEANPLHLEELLRSPEGAAATVVLIHGSFPYHDEAAYLATTRPHVYVDFSLFNLFTPATVAGRLLRLVDLAPTAKLLAGTDGHAIPESLWFAARVARDGWREVRTWLGDLGASRGWLDGVQRAIFADTARELYRL